MLRAASSLRFRAMLDVRSAIADAVRSALDALGVGPGSEVITVSHSFIATANAIRYCGATPVFVDIDPRTYNMDPSLIEARITPRTKVLLPVHIHGLPCDMDAIMDIARRHRLTVLSSGWARPYRNAHRASDSQARPAPGLLGAVTVPGEQPQHRDCCTAAKSRRGWRGYPRASSVLSDIPRSSDIRRGLDAWPLRLPWSLASPSWFSACG